jgi:hypothetical protein
MLLEHADVYVGAQAYPLFTMSRMPLPVAGSGKVALSHGWNGGEAGGARRDRTDDLKLAKLALSQLSYGPDPVAQRTESETSRPATSMWWAWEDLNFRPHAYQARALTN